MAATITDPRWAPVRSLCEEIRMPQRAVDALAGVYAEPRSSGLAELRRYVEPLSCGDYAQSQAASKELLARTGIPNVFVTAPDTAVTVLAVYLEAALRTWETVYVPRGIGRDVFAATMANMSLFMGERIAAYGDVLFDRSWWCGQYTSGRQYRIGMLNFEMAVSDGTWGDGAPASVSGGESGEGNEAACPFPAGRACCTSTSPRTRIWTPSAPMPATAWPANSSPGTTRNGPRLRWSPKRGCSRRPCTRCCGRGRASSPSPAISRCCMSTPLRMRGVSSSSAAATCRSIGCRGVPACSGPRRS